ncbi:MAG: EAL domain-containing protein [Nostoc sp.]|uniref:EAL domain-containing protein n=1 Tax=Nostoc sp. TaxID=1180 RepID=UPI002FFBF6FC
MIRLLEDYQYKELLREENNTVLYRGIKGLDQTPVLIKYIKTEYPTLEDIARLKYEYKILQSLDIAGIVKCYILEDSHQFLAMILEDFGGNPLPKYLSQTSLDLNDFLHIGIQLAETLVKLHQYKITHKNLKTTNVLFNPQTGQVKIDDFSLATYLYEEKQTISNQNIFENALAYISPEQTGRMNRLVDYRSDFYSLGIVFYEMLTRQLPFQSTDPLELVHCHIARTPISPCIFAKNLGLREIPQAVSDVVMKLLAKTAEERYQNALGLKAELVFNKTQGNPFFLLQLLKSLYQDKLNFFNFNQACWQWDIENLLDIDITDNVVELMVSRIQKLLPATQNVMKLGACVGDKFTLEVLSIVNEKSLSETALHLWEALQVGLILPLNQYYKIPLVIELEKFSKRHKYENTSLLTVSSPPTIVYKFLHDRVQQAAYSLIPKAECSQTHLRIGELLLEHTPEVELEENIFEIVNHLNIGTHLLTQQKHKDELVVLNLMAGQKAKRATAYDLALKYLKVGLGLLSEKSWQTNYDLTLALYVEATSSEFLNNNFEQTAILADIVLSNAKNILDKVKVYEIQIQYSVSQNKLKEAIAIIQVIEMLGITLSQEPPHALTKQYENSLTIESLSSLPPMTDDYKLAAMRILVAATPATYFAAAQLFTSITFTMVDLCIQYGSSAMAAYGYACYGSILAGQLEEIDAAYQSCLLALQLLDRYNAKELKAEICEIFNGHVRHFKDPLTAVLEPMLEGIQSGLEVGKVQYASYIAAFYSGALFYTGENLESVAQKLEHRLELLNSLKNQVCIDYAKIWQQMVANLVGDSTHKFELVSDRFNETEILKTLIAADNQTALSALYLANHTILIARNGNEFPIDDSAAPIRASNGKIIGAVMVFHDVSRNRNLSRQLSWQASHDALTGLVNRREFERHLEQAINDAKMHNEQYVLCYLDLDQFKIVNDTCGHIAGDELLRQVTALFQSQVRKTDALARIGGDEFGLLLNQCSIEQAQRVCNSIRQKVQELRFAWQEKLFTIGISIGLVMINTLSESVAHVLSLADAACYAAKNRGRNRVHVYQVDDIDLLRQKGEIEWVTRITHALEENRFCLYYQTIIPVLQTEMKEQHYEVLLRLQDETGALVLPMAFIPAAERYNLMHLIDRWVIRTLFATQGQQYRDSWNDCQSKNQECNYCNYIYAINLSGASINDEHFIEFIHEQFALHQIPPQMICFEITETVAISNLGKASLFINELRNLGCRFALDDFGSGMSSFTYLKNLPVDFLKIDGSFIRQIVDNSIDLAIVEAINHVGHIMGLQTIAEFVENDTILEKIKVLGVDYAQGYGIAKPCPFL